MVGYRTAFNLSYEYEDAGGNSSQTCSFDDDIRTSSILVIIALAGGWGQDLGLSQCYELFYYLNIFFLFEKYVSP